MNAIALVVIVLTIVPVFIAQRLTSGTTSKPIGRDRRREQGGATRRPALARTQAAETPAPTGQATPVPPSPQ